LQERKVVSSLCNGILSGNDIVLRVVLLLDSQDLNFVAWNKAIRAREQLLRDQSTTG
jgi:hypothetical protein